MNGMGISGLLSAVALAAISATPASAADNASDGGFYVQLRAGVQSVSDPKGAFFDEAGTFSGGDVELDAVPAGSDSLGVKFRTKSSASFGADIGYDFGQVRAELGLTYGRNKVNGLTVRSLNGAAATGLTDEDAQAFCDYLADGEDATTCTLKGNTISAGGSFAKLRQLGAMVSLWYDVPTGSPLEPYVGGGVGLVGYHIATGDDGEGKVRFGWQIGGGVAYKLSRNVALTADYRYRQVKGATFDDEGSGLVLGKLKTSLVSAGLRFTL